jgi:hypothetical protein
MCFLDNQMEPPHIPESADSRPHRGIALALTVFGGIGTAFMGKEESGIGWIPFTILLIGLGIFGRDLLRKIASKRK